MRPALPASDYYGGSAPTQQHQQTLRLPSPNGARDHRAGSHVHCRSIDGIDDQLFPCGHATTTAQSLVAGPRDHQPAATETESPGKSRASHAPQSRPRSTGLEPTASLEGVQTLVHLRFAAPSRLPHPRSPVVPPRHGVVRAACHPLPQLRDQAALSFHQAAAAAQRRGLSPRSNPTAPRGAPFRPCRAPPPARAG